MNGTNILKMAHRFKTELIIKRKQRDGDLILSIKEDSGSIFVENHGNQFNFSVKYLDQLQELERDRDVENAIRRFISLLSEQGLVISRKGGNINYKGICELEFIKSDKMVDLIKKFRSLEEIVTENAFTRLRYRGLTSKFVATAKRPSFKASKIYVVSRLLEIEVGFAGHYVAGSYRHDYEAAKDYLKVLNENLAPLKFEWLDYNSSNDHLYTFKTHFRI